jgi:hypothetical protein
VLLTKQCLFLFPALNVKGAIIMYKFEVKGLMFHKKTDSRSTFHEFTVAASSKQAATYIKFRLKDYHLRDVSIDVVREMPDKSSQLKLAL